MTDILDRLRSVDPRLTEGVDWTLFDDAANEIVRLRAKLSLAETAITQFDLDAKEAAAEIERLRAALDIAVKVQREVQDEKERLRETLREIRENEDLRLT